ncbi:hypothetical protein C7474_2461 [Microbacterium telephonicum]|uniref:Uncharacterized protein n=1 Tax=Microbacterium telephonicum TaxID=1714841 RepID=A0A498BWX6_9MICO|nr:hypothetical protein C7474_2461 [Microbacterium telephonicum]
MSQAIVATKPAVLRAPITGAPGYGRRRGHARAISRTAA